MAIVAALVEYGLDISVTGNGTTDPVPGSYTYAEGTVVPITAYPDEGWMLDHWELDGAYAGTSTTINVTMDAYHAVLAVFVQQTFTLTLESGVGGTTDVAPGSYTYYYGDTVTITAFPDAGYVFSHWSLNGLIDTDNPLIVTVTRDLTVTPVFTLAPTATLTGVVVNDATGEPVAGASISLDGYSTTSGTDGSYSLTVPLGTYTMTVSKSGFYTWTRTVELPAEQEYTVEVRLTEVPPTPPPAESIVQGTITDAETNLPIADATVTINTYSTTSDVDGNFVLTVTPAVYSMTVTKEEYEDWSQTIDVTTAGTYITNVALTKEAVPPAPIEMKWILIGIVAIGLVIIMARAR